jgi:hypothetical protein
MPAATGNDTGEVSSSGHSTSRNTALATARRTMTNAPARALSFRSWRSPPTVRRASVRQATGLPLANKKKTLKRSFRRPLSRTSIACLCRVPWQAVCAEIRMTKLHRSVDEFADLEEKRHRSFTTGDLIGRDRPEAQRRAGVQRSARLNGDSPKGACCDDGNSHLSTRTAICVVP